MHKTILHNFPPVIAIVMLCLTAVANADGRIRAHVGKIDAIDHQRYQIVVGDLPLKLTATTKIFSPEHKPMLIGELKKGSSVACKVLWRPGSGLVVTELKQLKSGELPRPNNGGR